MKLTIKAQEHGGFGLFQVIYPIYRSEFVCRGERMQAVLDCIVNLIQYGTW